MDQIKFRGWIKFTKEMISPEALRAQEIYIGTNGHAYLLNSERAGRLGIFYGLKPLLFTGLLDSVGGEIYDGDILDYIEINGTLTRGLVEWMLGGFCVRQIGAEHMFEDLRNRPIGSKVIGNMYENAYLLETK